MMDVQTLARAAEVYADARLQHIRLGSIDEEIVPREEADGYAIQNRLLAIYEKRGLGKVVAYKVGLVSADMRRQMGGSETLGFDNPVYAGIPARNLFFDEARLPFQENTRTYVEGEFAVRISKDVPTSSIPYDRESIQEYVSACAAGMEIVEWAVDYWSLGSPNGPAMIADDGANAGGIVCEGVEAWRTLDLGSLHASMIHNGKQVSTGYGRDLQGHPFDVLAWTVGHMARHGRSLHAGDYVLLGSVTASYGEFEKGSEIVVRWDELGEVRVTFD